MRVETQKPSVRSAQFAYPRDRFDAATTGKRVGAHRLSSKGRGSVMFLLVGFLVTVLLVAAGAFWVNSVGGSGASQDLVVAPEAPVEQEAVIDPTATIAILNGTPIPSLQFTVENFIATNGLGQVVFGEYASEREVQISAVFYQAVEDEPAARALAAQLGGVSTYQSDDYVDFGVRLTVLLGQDYAGPGLVEAQQTETGDGVDPAVENVLPEQVDELGVEAPVAQ